MQSEVDQYSFTKKKQAEKRLIHSLFCPFRGNWYSIR